MPFDSPNYSLEGLVSFSIKIWLIIVFYSRSLSAADVTGRVPTSLDFAMVVKVVLGECLDSRRFFLRQLCPRELVPSLPVQLFNQR